MYLKHHIEAGHANYRKKIVLVTTGDLKQEVLLNWTSYVDDNKKKALFEFWSGDKVAELIENHMLDEHVFANDDRVDLRKAMALAGDADYSFDDFDRLVMRQLELRHDGSIEENAKQGEYLKKSLVRLNLALTMFVKTAQDAGDTRQGVLASEHVLLKAWHRLKS